MKFTEKYTAAEIAKMVTEISEMFEAQPWANNVQVYPTVTGISVAMMVGEGVSTVDFLHYQIQSARVMTYTLSHGLPRTTNFVVNYVPKKSWRNQ